MNLTINSRKGVEQVNERLVRQVNGLQKEIAALEEFRRKDFKDLTKLRE